MQISGVQAALFDFDGTLIDTMDENATIAGEVLQRTYGMAREQGSRLYLETSGIPFFQQIELIVPGGARNSAAVEEFEQRKLEGFFSATYLPDVPPALATLRERGIKVILSSNNYQDLVDRFVADRAEVVFDLALGCRDNFFKGRDHFNEVSRRYGIDPKGMLFVGDSFKDAERAMESGVRFVAITRTFSVADFQARYPGLSTIRELGELLSLLE